MSYRNGNNVYPPHVYDEFRRLNRASGKAYDEYTSYRYRNRLSHRPVYETSYLGEHGPCSLCGAKMKSVLQSGDSQLGPYSYYTYQHICPVLEKWDRENLPSEEEVRLQKIHEEASKLVNEFTSSHPDEKWYYVSH